MKKHQLTEEEKVARTIGKIVSDLRLDLEMLGFYLAHTLPNVALTRLNLINEATQESRENVTNHTIQ